MKKDSLSPNPACQICGWDKRCDLHRGVSVRPLVAELIQQELGRWSEEGWICTARVPADPPTGTRAISTTASPHYS